MDVLFSLAKVGIIVFLAICGLVCLNFVNGHGFINTGFNFFIVSLVGLSILIFYESAIKKNKRILFLLIMSILSFSIFFTFKKNRDKKNIEILNDLVEINKKTVKRIMECEKIKNMIIECEGRVDTYEEINELNKNLKKMIERLCINHSIVLEMLKKNQIGTISRDNILEIYDFCNRLDEKKFLMNEEFGKITKAAKSINNGIEDNRKTDWRNSDDKLKV